MDLFVAFITGVTTGGLSCLAVQGGLLASSLAHQIEEDLQIQSGAGGAQVKFRPQLAQPILLFLVAKLIAYTLLGLLLGALGSVLQLTPIMRAVLTLGIGIFMLGNGLRMLKVHPIFRYFIIEPPSFLTRYIRRTSKTGASSITTAFLGALTVLIPCGVAQAMMAVALGTGDPLQGAAILFAFTLGTSPVFFSVAYFATRLGATIEKHFTRIVALVVIVLGLVSIDAGLNLAGSPLSFSKFVSNLSGAPAEVSQNPASAQDGFTVNVIDEGYTPKVLHLSADKPVSLNWVTQDVSSCALSVVVPGLNYQKVLPHTGTVKMDIPAQASGSVIHYSCSMGMYTGQLVFDLE